MLPSVAVPQRQASNLFSIYPHHLCKVSPTLTLNTIHIRQPPKPISTRMLFDPQTQIALLCLSSKTLIPLHAQYSKHLVCSFWVFFPSQMLVTSFFKFLMPKYQGQSRSLLLPPCLLYEDFPYPDCSQFFPVSQVPTILCHNEIASWLGSLHSPPSPLSAFNSATNSMNQNARRIVSPFCLSPAMPTYLTQRQRLCSKVANQSLHDLTPG